jgi:hypothetical protein
MLNRPDVDPVIVRVRADPFDEDDGLLEIDTDDEPVTVALDVEDHEVSGDDAGCRGGPLRIRRSGPLRLADCPIPRVERGFNRRLITLAGPRFDKPLQCSSSNDPHCKTLP